MFRFFLCIFLYLSLGSYSHAEELWACDGFTSSRDGSQLDPFLMRGSPDYYEWRGEYKDFNLKKVGENRAVDFDIYVDGGANTSRAAYYMKKDGSRLEIRQFLWRSYLFYTNCVRQ